MSKKLNKLQKLIEKMTLEEKVEQLSGIGHKIGEFGDQEAKYFGTADNQRLGIPGFKMAHALTGIRIGRDTSVKSTYYISPIAMGATWDRDLQREVAVTLARETLNYNHTVVLSPTLNLIRHPLGGRNWEHYSEDPYLNGQMGLAYIKGIQSQNVIACPKHFVCNNQETDRFNVNVVVDERTLREIYLYPFKIAIKKGKARSIMGAFNKLNDVFCCENQKLLKGILRDEWGFQGFVLSDFGKAVHSTKGSVTAGLDMEMHAANFYGEQLVQKVEKGNISKEQVDKLVYRVLKAKYWTGVLDNSNKLNKKYRETESNRSLAYKASEKSITLLKNNKEILPLNKNEIDSVGVIGFNSSYANNDEIRSLEKFMQGEGSARSYPSNIISPLEGLKSKVGQDLTINSADPTPPYRGFKKVAKNSDVVVIAAGLCGNNEGEGEDREEFKLPYGQVELIQEVSKLNSNVIVVLIHGGPVGMTEWIDDVSAVLDAFYPGQEGGHVIADAIFGDINPGGKLPYTVPKDLKQLPPSTKPRSEEIHFSEKHFFGYRYFDSENLNPLFPFGHGLSYTTFEYEDMQINPVKSKTNQPISIKVKIKNTGSVKGDEVVQLYINYMDSKVEHPQKELKEFRRVTLLPGESTIVEFDLKKDAFTYYDVNQKEWMVEPGSYEILVGSSSRDIRLNKTIEKVV